MKKSLVFILALTVLALPLSFSAWAAEKPVKLITENTYPSTHARFGAKAVLGQWMDAVEKESKGSITFERHWAGEPVPAKEALNALEKGTLDVLMGFPHYWSGKIAIADVAGMPKNFKTFADIYDLWWNSPMGDIIDKVYQKKAKAKFMWPAIFAPEDFQVGKRAKKVRKVDDFRGMKIRGGGGTIGATIKALGGSPVATVGGEYYTAMQRGTIDMGLMTTYSLETYKMWEVCDQVVGPPIFNHCFVGVWMNLDKWNALSPRQRFILINTARKMETHFIAYCELDDSRVIKLAKSKGVEFYTFPPEEQKKMWAAVLPVWKDYVELCKKQGTGKEAQQVADIVQKRFDDYD